MSNIGNDKVRNFGNIARKMFKTSLDTWLGSLGSFEGTKVGTCLGHQYWRANLESKIFNPMRNKIKK